MTTTKRIFISHDTEDAQFARRLANDLQRRGVSVWIAPESIQPGEDWVSAIERGLQESSHMIVVLTPAAVDSGWVKTEINAAIDMAHKGRMKVIPLDVKPCRAPLLLSGYQMISFSDYDAGFKQLTKTLDLHPVGPKQGVSAKDQTAKYQVYRAENDQYYFQLRAGTGERVLVSEGYATKAACLYGIEDVKQNASSYERYQRRVAANGRFYFVLVAPNGQIIGTSPMYTACEARDKAIERVMRIAHSSHWEDTTTI
jgi:uncharacterized protein YegP (UPF0339 family)